MTTFQVVGGFDGEVEIICQSCNEVGYFGTQGTLLTELQEWANQHLISQHGWIDYTRVIGPSFSREWTGTGPQWKDMQVDASRVFEGMVDPEPSEE